MPANIQGPAQEAGRKLAGEIRKMRTMLQEASGVMEIGQKTGLEIKIEYVKNSVEEGIRQAVELLTARRNSLHDAHHEAMACLGQMVWESQRAGRRPRLDQSDREPAREGRQRDAARGLHDVELAGDAELGESPLEVREVARDQRRDVDVRGRRGRPLVLTDLGHDLRRAGGDDLRGEVLDQLSGSKGGAGGDAAATSTSRARLPSPRLLWSLRGSLVRGLGTGVVIGAIPGAGATVASFVSYGLEKQVSKEPERFGTGVLEGLTASETSVNASTGGAMIPLLTLGIPGSGATAVMMGAFLLHGVQPGPLLFSKSPHEVYTIFVGMLLANLIMIVMGLLAARSFAQLMKVPEPILAAFIITFCFIGAYALRNDMADVWLTMLFGVLGFFMRRYNLPIPPLILGVILGPLAEQYFLTSMVSYGNDVTVFFTRPVSAAVLLTSAGLLLWPALKGWLARRKALRV